MTGTEPLNEDGSPPHREVQTVKLKMENKMVPIKKAKLTFLWYDNFSEKDPLQRNGMAAIPKIVCFWLFLNFGEASPCNGGLFDVVHVTCTLVLYGKIHIVTYRNISILIR